jgi:hypothetical protein
MRHPSAAVALLASAVIGGLGLTPTAAQAQAPPPSSEARAAWVKRCYDHKLEEDYPCGPWKLVMRDGTEITVRGTAGFRIDGRGKKVRTFSTFAISGNGRVIGYERDADHRLVLRRASGGPVTELPRSLLPESAGTSDVGLFLSPAGDRVLADYTDRAKHRHVKVLTPATGHIVELPAQGTTQGFSGDGDEVYVSRALSDNTTTLYAYGLDGRTTRRTAPQFVDGALSTALSADGHTVAAFTPGNAEAKRPPRMRTFDLETGRLSEAVDLPLTPGDPPSFAQGTPDGQIIVFAYNSDSGTSTVVRVLTVDPGSGTTRQTDTYRVSESNHIILLPGE